MLPYPTIDPVLFRIGPVAVHWYGVMYLLGFAAGWWLGRVRARAPGSEWRVQDIDDLLFYSALGIVMGGRLGYILFYGLPQYLDAPLEALKIWRGGMSFHGGFLGVLVAMWLYGRKIDRSFFQVMDFIAPLIPLGLMAGRIGNFINGELWGRLTDLPWGMVPPDPYWGGVARHPSQLYQALLEGLVLFVILWWFSRRPRPVMAVSGMFLIWYGIFRFAVEFVRVPDAHLGYLAFGWLTMGQIL
ncbi:MAG: prolipoprotein diacylglyceryl transferase, partial [Gammaproteobacteria bacterium]|nr:prolipoprotein diacylglyceryl transferase [Gammaproteobacteria bacterium]